MLVDTSFCENFVSTVRVVGESACVASVESEKRARSARTMVVKREVKQEVREEREEREVK